MDRLISVKLLFKFEKFSIFQYKDLYSVSITNFLKEPSLQTIIPLSISQTKLVRLTLPFSEQNKTVWPVSLPRALLHTALVRADLAAIPDCRDRSRFKLDQNTARPLVTVSSGFYRVSPQQGPPPRKQPNASLSFEVHA